MRFYGLLLSLFFLINSGCDGNRRSSVNCTKWHTGNFEIVDASRNIMIERDSDVQIETDRNTSSYTKYTINWIDDCTYQLIFLEGEEGIFQAWKGNYMEVTITGPTADGYSYSARFSNSETTERGQIKQIPQLLRK